MARLSIVGRRQKQRSHRIVPLCLCFSSRSPHLRSPAIVQSPSFDSLIIRPTLEIIIEGNKTKMAATPSKLTVNGTSSTLNSGIAIHSNAISKIANVPLVHAPLSFAFNTIEAHPIFARPYVSKPKGPPRARHFPDPPLSSLDVNGSTLAKTLSISR